jgi:3-isopropylmalate/(R)-2-methylmalate dehydratase large subunit
VPESLKISLTGRFKPWVTSKDIALFMIGQLGADGGLYASVEFHGEAVAAMSMESRFVLPNMMAEMGAKNAWVVQDAVTFEWLEARAGAEAQAKRQRWEALSRELAPDPGATYLAEYHFDASALEPQVACPHRVDAVQPLSQVAGIKVQQAFLGTCTNGRLEDLAAAAAVVKGKRVAAGTRLLVIPASSQVYLEALQSGYVETLLTAGAHFGTPGCGPCMGNHMGVPAPGEVTISSANRNFQGRMGTRDSEIYLASPAVVAASAIAGQIAGPEEI